MQDVMVDLETLDTKADGSIISIGAVRFDPNSDKIDDAGFYASISIDSNLAVGRSISESTLLFWMQQSKEAQSVFFEPKQTLEDALDSFSAWFGPSKYIWSNGADFDIPMLAHAMRGFGWDTPWDFWNARCVRTYKNLPGARDVKVENTAKHNALSDALAQARLIQAIQRKLTGGHSMVKA